MNMNKYFLFFSMDFPVSGVLPIARHLNISYSAAQPFLSELVREGYITKKADINNLRKTVYDLTSKGKMLQHNVKKTKNAMMDK